MKTFYSLTRHYDGIGQFSIVSIIAKDRDTAWEEAENYAMNDSEQWLLSSEELGILQKLIRFHIGGKKGGKNEKVDRRGG